MWTAASVLVLLFALPLLTTAQQCDNANPCQFTGGDAYTKTAEVTSSNGALTQTVTVDISDVTIEWLTTKRRTYNGGIPGPTFRLKAGDNLALTLVNNLGPQPVGEHNEYRDPNSTNIHTHGLHISPMEPQDYVFLEVGPGETYNYNFQLNENQNAGTFWYHGHHHGSAFFQVASGMAGLLIVEDEWSSMSAELAAISCPTNCDKEVPMLLGKFLDYNGGEDSFAEVQNDIGDPFRLDDTVTTSEGVTLSAYLTDQQTGVSAYMVNGQVRPVITMQPGEIRRFRMVNAGPRDQLLLTITGCEITILAYDGVYVDTPYSQDFIFIPTGGRSDAAVRCATAGTYELRSGNNVTHVPSLGETDVYGGVIATIEVTGAAMSMSFPTATPAKPSYLDDLRTVEDSAIGGRYVVELGPDPYLNRERFTNATYYRYNFDVDTIQEWIFTNTDEDDGHPLHLHVTHFQVISYNSYPGPINGEVGGGVGAGDAFAYYDLNGNLCDQQHKDFYPDTVNPSITVDTTYLGHDTNDRNLAGYARLGEFRDVLLIPPLASVKVRFIAADYIGPYVLHCHILNHEDQGMMMVTYSAPAGQASQSPWESSGGHNPGTCSSTDVYPDILQNTIAAGNKHAVSNGWLTTLVLTVASINFF
ncbi:laccase-2-like [Branchiostoma floridae]|uniref:ferroxidase n=1 Tax=Branchiostoma floridae TaxID=7739 RepID=A0A9J7HM65_BRAFL|nr:laccase-2-like [Branchiostoma floridae]